MEFAEYLVISNQSAEFTTGFNPLRLQVALNSYAQLGWRVVSSSVSILPRGASYYIVFLIILERVVGSNTTSAIENLPGE